MTPVIAVVVLIAGTVAGLAVVNRLAPALPSKRSADPDLDADATALRADPAGVATPALVTGLRQSGASRGSILYRCELGLRVLPPGDAPIDTTIEADVHLGGLARVLPGSTVEVLLHAGGSCTYLPGATRVRATGLDRLPPVSCRGVPDHVLLKPEERVIEGARTGTAVIGCLDIDTPYQALMANTTLGLWVDDTTPTRISERLSVVQLVALPRGATVDVLVDPADPTRVAVDLRAAVRALASRFPGPDALRAALVDLAIDAPVGVVRSVTTTTRQTGVRHRIVVRGDRVDADGSTEPFECRVMCAIPEFAPIVPATAVVLGTDDDGGMTVDLQGTERARVRCAQSEMERR